MHPLLRDSAYSLIPEIEKKHLWAAQFLLGDFSFQRVQPQLSNEETKRLLNAWSHAIKAGPASELATKIAWSLRSALTTSGSYAQLMLVLENTSPFSAEYKELFAIQKARILNVWGQHDDALELLDRLPKGSSPSIEREIVLVKASVLTDFGKAEEAIALLKAQRSLFQNLKSSPHSARYLNRLIEAHLSRADYETAYGYASKTFESAQVEKDNVQGARAARQMARALLGRGSPKKAIQFALLSAELFSDLSHIREKALSSQIASEAYEADGDFKNAIDLATEAQNGFELIGDTRKKEALSIRIANLRRP